MPRLDELIKLQTERDALQASMTLRERAIALGMNPDATEHEIYTCECVRGDQESFTCAALSSPTHRSGEGQ